MNFPKSNNTAKDLIISSEMILWEGPDIPCIDLCKGEKTSSVIYKIGKLLCDIYTDIEDLKNLTYPCILTSLNQINDLKDPTKFSLKLLIQLLLDNDCKLQDLIKSIPTTSNTSSVNLIGLNLSCIESEIINLCGQVPDNLDPLKVLQAIINILCGLQDEVADILIRLINIETKIAGLGNPNLLGYTEPNITSCLSTIPTQLNLHVTSITDEAICDLSSLVGTQAQVTDILDNMCIEDYLNNPDIIKSPTSIAEAAKNKSIIICDLLERIKSIENTCCAFTCSDIKIGFTQSYNASLNEYQIVFSFGAGTDIPIIFSDCGSEFIITDWKGTTKTISNTPGTLTNGSVFNIALTGSGLDFAKPMVLEIKTCFTNTLSGLICKDCFGGTLDASVTTASSTCWDFIIPKTNALGCGNKFINYHSLITTKGVFLASNTNTSTGSPNPTNLILPIFSTPNSIVSNVICNNNSLLITLNGQSTADPPRLKLAITNTAPLLFIDIVGTLNTNCLC